MGSFDDSMDTYISSSHSAKQGGIETYYCLLKPFAKSALTLDKRGGMFNGGKICSEKHCGDWRKNPPELRCCNEGYFAQVIIDFVILSLCQEKQYTMDWSCIPDIAWITYPLGDSSDFIKALKNCIVIRFMPIRLRELGEYWTRWQSRKTRWRSRRERRRDVASFVLVKKRSQSRSRYLGTFFWTSCYRL